MASACYANSPVVNPTVITSYTTHEASPSPIASNSPPELSCFLHNVVLNPVALLWCGSIATIQLKLHFLVSLSTRLPKNIDLIKHFPLFERKLVLHRRF